MFLDVEVIENDKRLALGESAIASLSTHQSNPARGLGILYKEILETMREEAARVAAVFPNPKAVMALLVQRVMMQRVNDVLEAVLPKPELDDPPSMKQGGLLLVR